MARRTAEELWAARQAPRKRREGSIFTITVDGKVKYRATFTLYMDENGNAVQVSGTGDSAEEAIRRRGLNFMKRQVQLGNLPASVLTGKPKELKKTTGEVLDEWLAWKSIQKTNKKSITPMVASQYESIIRLHLKPAIGNIPVRLVSRKVIETLLFETLQNKRKMVKDEFGNLVETDEELLGLSKLRAIQGVVSMAFRWAKEERFITEDPTIAVPKFNKPVSPAEEENLESKMWIPAYLAQKLEGHPDEARWMLLITCGLRAGEKLGAEWDCFSHLSDGKLSTFEVRQQLAVDPTTKRIFIERRTKSPAGKRIIPLDKRMVKILKNYRKQQDEWKKSPDWNPPKGLENLVFTTRTGQPIRHQTDTKQWRSLLAAYKIDFIRQHAMRHIAISWMVRLGQPIEIIRSIAGHDSESITLATYTHLSAGAKKPTLEAYTDEVFKARDTNSKNAKASETT